MIDLRRFFAELTQIIGIDVPDAVILAAALDLDLSPAHIVKTKSVMAVHDAQFNHTDIAVDAALGVRPAP